MAMNQEFLKRTLNRVYDDGGKLIIKRLITSLGSSPGDRRAMLGQLAVWEEQGYVKIIKDFDECLTDDALAVILDRIPESN